MKRLEPKHPLAIRWFHWINFPVLFLMMWSGLLIYWANDVYRLGLGGWTLFHFFPKAFYEKLHVPFRLAEGMAWHFTFAWIFAINGLLYVGYLAFSGEWRQLIPGRKTLGEAIQVVLHDLHIRKQPLPRHKFNGAQRIAYSGVIVMGAGMVLTGLAIYKPVQAALISAPLSGIGGATAYEVARFLHFWITLAFLRIFPGSRRASRARRMEQFSRDGDGLRSRDRDRKQRFARCVRRKNRRPTMRRKRSRRNGGRHRYEPRN